MTSRGSINPNLQLKVSRTSPIAKSNQPKDYIITNMSANLVYKDPLTGGCIYVGDLFAGSCILNHGVAQINQDTDVYRNVVKLAVELNIKMVLNFAKGMGFDGVHKCVVTKNEILYIRFDIDDSMDADIKSLFPITNYHIQKTLQNGESILIHCKEGISRSPTVACAYLISIGYIYEEALSIISKARPVSEINIGFQSQLINYSNEI